MYKFIKSGKKLNGVVYKTKNVVIQKIQEGSKKNRCYIIGNGQSLSVNDEDIITKHDPAMYEFKPKIDKDNTVYAFYYTFECLGLEETSREIAQFVNDLSEEYKQIFLVGQSKCGVCLYNASHYCKKDIILVTISTPFQGTVIADKDAVEKMLKSRMLKKLYNKIFSDHNVDRDIKPNSQFIQNLMSPRYKEHINITATFKNVFCCKNIVDLFLFVCNKAMKIKGDGLVSLISQQIKCTRTINLFCSHVESLIKGIEILENL